MHTKFCLFSYIYFFFQYCFLSFSLSLVLPISMGVVVPLLQLPNLYHHYSHSQHPIRIEAHTLLHSFISSSSSPLFIFLTFPISPTNYRPLISVDSTRYPSISSLLSEFPLNYAFFLISCFLGVQSSVFSSWVPVFWALQALELLGFL